MTTEEKRFLVVEDDFVSRTLIQGILSPYGLCHVASNGKEAVQAFTQSLAENRPYDLICLDIMMPEMDGQAALLQIRKIEEEKGIGGQQHSKIIMTTSLDDPKNIMKALIKGMSDAYLAKPIKPENLLNKCRELGIIK